MRARECANATLTHNTHYDARHSFSYFPFHSMLFQGEIGDDTTTLRVITAPPPHYEQFREGTVKKGELTMHSGRNLHDYVKEGEVVMEVQCDNAAFESFEAMVASFIAKAQTAIAGRTLKSAAFSTSGPVDEYANACVYDRSTAFSVARQAWGGVDGASLAEALKVDASKVAIVNDVSAAALGTLTLHEDETVSLFFHVHIIV